MKHVRRDAGLRPPHRLRLLWIPVCIAVLVAVVLLAGELRN